MRVPVATYRLQLYSEFGFDEARVLLPYLDQLGVTDLYASPLLQAVEGSEHGYDVTDPRRIDPGVGDRGDFTVMSAALRERKMGLLLDIVPNHMAASTENPWWRDVLRWGSHSVHASKFDIDWEAGREPGAPTGQLVLPILGAPLAEVLGNGELKLALSPDGFEILYHDKYLPVCPDTYQLILDECFQDRTEASEHQSAALRLLTSLMTANGDKINVNGKQAGQVGKQLWELYKYELPVRECVDRIIKNWSDAAGRARLADLLARQHYRPVYWRDARHQINYRRFFDINDLVSLQIEDEAVFRAVHGRVLGLAREGAVTGLRIDHVDGLHDPEGYLVRLQAYLEAAILDRGSSQMAPPMAVEEVSVSGFYVLVEKILEAGEELPVAWPVAGTTGYDFMNMLNGLFVDAKGLDVLDQFYSRMVNTRANFTALVDQQKRQVMGKLFPGEMAKLAKELECLAALDPRGHELAPSDLAAALVGVTAAFPVYRTYTRGFVVTPRDREYIEQAVAGAARRGDGSGQAREFLRRVLLLEFTDHQPEATRHGWLRFVMRWQQFTGPIMAKGYEDTVLYLYNRLISLNEVGGDPVGGVVSVPKFHHRMRDRRQRSPHTMNATSTHDTKRSEDVRARINVLSEIPELWTERVTRWREWNAGKKPQVAGRPVPEDNAELLVYQTLVGAWPLRAADEADFGERLKEYLVKASREAKAYTSWLDPDEEYEAALGTFAERILIDTTDNRFRQDLLRLTGPVAYYGALNSLAQVVLKVMCPGVPDFYRGTEVWDLSLVDPDNRRPVDFERLTALLAELQQREVGPALVQELLAAWDDGRVKMYVTWQALSLRRARAELFASGDYVPLGAAGTAQEHLCALARHAGEHWVVAAVPRLPVRLTGAGPVALPVAKPPVGEAVWGDTVLILPAAAPTCWRNVFTGETVGTAPAVGNPGVRALPLARVLGTFPVALLTPDG